MNQKIRKLENDLADVLIASDLLPEVKRIILGKLEAQLTNISNQEILAEVEAEKNAKSIQSDDMEKPSEHRDGTGSGQP